MPDPSWENVTGDNNNRLAAQLPADPYAELRALDRLGGNWQATSDFLRGSLSFEFTSGAELGPDSDAQPSLDEVLRSRSARKILMADFLSKVSVGELRRSCPALDGQFTVLGAAQNVIFEEWAHHQYAVRDLTALR